MSTTSKGSRGRGSGSGKTTHSRSYPRGVGLDFRKLAGLTLMGYIDHHGKFLNGTVIEKGIDYT
jgi:hypothetical protein